MRKCFDYLYNSFYYLFCYYFCCKKKEKDKKKTPFKTFNEVKLQPTILEVKITKKKCNKMDKKKIKNKKNDSEDLNSSLNDLISSDNANNDSQFFQKLNVSDNSPIKVGLNNIGATCYMNATLQCLSNTDKLTDFFLKEYGKEPNKDNKIMANAYYEVIKALWNRKNNNKSISPYDFKEILSKENPLFAGIAANDSKDLINFLIERFHQELNKAKEVKQNINYNQIDHLDEQKMLNLFLNDFKINYDSIISTLFYGVLETKTQCQQCKYIKYNFQIYSFIEFPLEKVNQYCFQNGMRSNYIIYNNNKNPDIDLYECFQYYNNFELMTGENQMYCNMCNCTCDSLYGSILYSPPNYLIINLNRGRGAVYECKVNFDERLDLSNYFTLKSQNIFELYAVICHIGPSSMSGHFVAYCKNRMDKKWYLYNDGLISLCQSPNEYQKGMAYILFYQKIN